jgi:DNA (cytosine-5)-methyltransferase 1
MRPLRVIDLFAGAGGFSEGFRAAGGYEVVAAAEKDPTACRTLAVNHPETPILAETDLRYVTAHDLELLSDCSADLVIAGPPCQGFSLKGTRDPAHESTELLFDTVRLITELEPVAFLIENVPGLMSFRRGLVVDRLMRRLNALRVAGRRYWITIDTLDAAAYGVPQHRKRVFVCGVLASDYAWPMPVRDRISLIDAIGDLPEWTTRANEIARLPPGEPLTPYQRGRRRGATALYNHSAKRLEERRLERIAYLAEGDDRRALPDHLQAGGHEGKYRRLRSGAPAPTIVAHMAKDTSDFVHPRYERMLTVREAARLQSFPDRYRFAGSQYQQFRQVGNAVPVLLAAAIADSLELPLRRAVRKLHFGARPAATRRAITA